MAQCRTNDRIIIHYDALHLILGDSCNEQKIKQFALDYVNLCCVEG